MRPSDPEARKKYDQLAAEDERVRQRGVRNSALKAWGEDCRRMVEDSLAGFLGRGDLDGLATMTNTIASKVKDAPTRDQLLKVAAERIKAWAVEGSVQRFLLLGDLDGLAAMTNAIARKIEDARTRDQLLKRAEERSRRWAEEKSRQGAAEPPK
jgi:hypothetical protein